MIGESRTAPFISSNEASHLKRLHRLGACERALEEVRKFRTWEQAWKQWERPEDMFWLMVFEQDPVMLFMGSHKVLRWPEPPNEQWRLYLYDVFMEACRALEGCAMESFIPKRCINKKAAHLHDAMSDYFSLAESWHGMGYTEPINAAYFLRKIWPIPNLRKLVEWYDSLPE